MSDSEDTDSEWGWWQTHQEWRSSSLTLHIPIANASV